MDQDQAQEFLKLSKIPSGYTNKSRTTRWRRKRREKEAMTENLAVPMELDSDLEPVQPLDNLELVESAANHDRVDVSDTDSVDQTPSECGSDQNESETEVPNDWTEILECPGQGEFETVNTDKDSFADDTDVSDDDEDFACKTSTDTVEDRPIYQGAQITVATSMLLIMTFCLRHGLTGEALYDLLTLVELHCLAENLCQSTRKMYKDFFSNVSMPVLKHYFCQKCNYYCGSSDLDKCPLCGHGETGYFITIPLASQLQSLLKDESKRTLIQNYKSKRRQKYFDDNSIRDVHDAEVYRQHFDSDGFFQGSTEEQRNQLHLSIQLNTDGVAIFRSSTFSLWPVYAVLNELPPSARFAKENRFFLGLWFARTKPNMNLFLKPVVDELRSLYCDGTEVEGTICRVLLLSLVADAPARCLLAHMVQFNGAYGCPCCLHPGERLQVSAGGYSRVYPFSEASSSGHPDIRTHEETVKTAQNVDSEYYQSNLAQPVSKFGIKGSSILSLVPKFDLIKGNAIDYMHCVLLGITKMFVNLWVSVDHRNARWSVRTHLKTLNARLDQIKPPRFVTRIPRSFTELCHWKASEYRSFLLYYSLPILHDVLEVEYFQHWALLVTAIFILSSETITRSNLDRASINIRLFCSQTEALYGKRYCTFNFHSLLHLVEKVEALGPLWAHSCFYFESYNGDLRRMFHGTQNVHMQVMLAVCIQQKLPLLANFVKPESRAETFYYKLCKKKNRNETRIDGGFIVGALSQCCLQGEVDAYLADLIERGCVLHAFFRFRKDSQTIHSLNYTSEKRRNNYTVSYKKGTELVYGHVKYYLKCQSAAQVVYFAVIRPLLPYLTDNPLATCPFAHSVTESEMSELVPLQQIERQCVYVKFAPRNAFVLQCPNFVESD